MQSEMPSLEDFSSHNFGYGFYNDEVTFPNYLPTNIQSLPHKSNRIRQLVIEKQNQRVFPTYNRLLDRMEDALVRWRPPASSHIGLSLAIHGSHPYQKNFKDLKTLEEQKALGQEISESFEQVKQMVQNCWKKNTSVNSDKKQGQSTNSENEDNDSDSEYSLPPTLSDDIRNKQKSPALDTLSPSRKTPVAFPMKVKTESPQDIVNEIQNTLNTYKFPVPSYYLPAALRLQHQQNMRESECENNTEHQTGWDAWCTFWKDFWKDLNNLLVCSIYDEMY